MTVTATTEEPIILYVSGYGRSGSTLLDMLLDAHPRVAGLGELTQFFDLWLAGGSCSCSLPLRACPFWTRIVEALDITDMAAAAQLTRSVEARLAYAGAFNRPSDESHREYGRIWRSLLTAVGRHSGVQVIVDSSKTARDAGGRARALAEWAGLPVTTVHLVRDPRAVAWSVLRGSNRKLAVGAPARLPMANVRAYFGWATANARAMLLYRGMQSVRLRYEDLVADPERELARITSLIGIETLPPTLSGQMHENVSPGHGIAGNRLRRTPVTHIRADVEWRTRLPMGSRLLALAVWPLSRYYGYKR